MMGGAGTVPAARVRADGPGAGGMASCQHLCKNGIARLAAALAPAASLPDVNPPANLPALTQRLNALIAAAQVARLSAGGGPPPNLGALPPLPLPPGFPASPLVAAKLGAAGAGAQAVNASLGIDLASPQAAGPLASMGLSVALFGPKLGEVVASPGVAKLTALLPLVSALQTARALGVNLLSPHASKQLAGLAAQAGQLPARLGGPAAAGGLPAAPETGLGSPPAVSPAQARLGFAAVAMEAKARFGADLTAPGGSARLAASLKAMSSATIPDPLLNPPGLSPVGLGNLAALGAAVAAIREALGVDPLQPGALDGLPALLKPLEGLELPDVPALPPPPASPALMGPAAALAFGPRDVEALDLPTLAAALNAPAPNFGALPALAGSLGSADAALGTNLVWPGPLRCPFGCIVC